MAGVSVRGSERACNIERDRAIASSVSTVKTVWMYGSHDCEKVGREERDRKWLDQSDKRGCWRNKSTDLVETRVEIEGNMRNRDDMKISRVLSASSN